MAGAGALWQAAANAQETAGKTRVYRLDYLYYRQGDQGPRLNDFLAAVTPMMTKHARVFGVFSSVITPRLQTILTLTGFSGAADMTAAMAKIEADPDYRKAGAELERGAEPPYDNRETVVLAATDFSPEIVPLAEKPKSPRYFELRVYHSPTERQLRLLHERFSGAEIKIFHRVGVNPIFYADTLIGPDRPNLTYMMPFASLADREKAWDAFAADPEWIKVRNESVARGGQIVANNYLSLWRAAAYSAVQ
jgi:hypothetical protein